MLVPVVLCAALASSAFGAFNADQYIDSILRDLPLQFKVKGNGLLNRDLKVNVTQGSIIGLGSVLRRGHCTYGIAAGEYKLGCYVSLGAVRVLLNADVKGDSLIANTHSISTTTLVEDSSYALIEVQGRPGSIGRLSNVSLSPLTMTSSVTQGKLDLNSARISDFVRQLNAALATQISSAMRGPFANVLSTLISNRPFP
ncbi:uncharacterized protein LOC100904782 [Galendromus occidentalis]|uniref:Uncharacterized protein LOC100904782 n=1 Tax=Galendromus occidentalis TaxID=34638 RepID=A0AAJ6VV17_9ACAR|nr:uncharacterized protein LOC100904782 [Galendromus occidentalis]